MQPPDIGLDLTRGDIAAKDTRVHGVGYTMRGARVRLIEAQLGTGHHHLVSGALQDRVMVANTAVKPQRMHSSGSTPVHLQIGVMALARAM